MDAVDVLIDLTCGDDIELVGQGNDDELSGMNLITDLAGDRVAPARVVFRELLMKSGDRFLITITKL